VAKIVGLAGKTTLDELLIWPLDLRGQSCSSRVYYRSLGDIMGWTNPVRERMSRGEAVFGATITLPSTDIAARLACAGFDFLWFEMEHSPLTLQSVRDMILATRAMPALPMVRVPVTDLWTAKRVLDTGAAGVIFPFVSNAELARRAVAACKYPPVGLRGSGAALASFRWGFEDYYGSADREFLVVTVIEDRAGLENAEEIAAVDGIDVIFIGTSDLSFSLGCRGKQDKPEVQAAIARILNAAREKGKFAGRPAFPKERVGEYVRQGFQFFQADTDLGYLSQGAADFLKAVGKGVSKNDLAL
jgi:2-keto-3-deoxy-L-rhamnonate aldolase RhmA